MNAVDAKVGMKVKVDTTNPLKRLSNGVTGKITKIIPDPTDKLMGYNILVTFDAKCKAGKGNVFKASDLVIIK
ncbi:hypothetical protein pf16_57 [Pseudomonas phage pf16]|uniref:Uncharacterized protein n=1 Tax=Pseudomonas phage pf16 TaxID=1815630 RepID=A0A1S5R610_9CAUD|nr:hypothetical protein FDG98_gp056 [Pseudomonas phage pf16]AND74980.1 hypothetical protein pf16_57 [Pseudomonas phage pf16]